MATLETGFWINISMSASVSVYVNRIE
jgi:hypothetical protein